MVQPTAEQIEQQLTWMKERAALAHDALLREDAEAASLERAYRTKREYCIRLDAVLRAYQRVIDDMERDMEKEVLNASAQPKSGRKNRDSD